MWQSGGGHRLRRGWLSAKRQRPPADRSKERFFSGESPAGNWA